MSRRRFVVFGAGAVGGVVGVRLAMHGHDVLLIARGPHHDVIRADGLRLQEPAGETTVPLPVVDAPARIDWQPGDVVMLAVKSHQTAAALDALARAAPQTIPIVCVQNGIVNEYEALRRFPIVYGVFVAVSAEHHAPGLVAVYASAPCGILDVGRFPHGGDDLSDELAAAFESSGFSSRPVAQVQRWKWRKLLSNLGNAIEVVCIPSSECSQVVKSATAEAERVLSVAGIDYATDAEDRERRETLGVVSPIAGRRRPGGSTWQSVARQADGIETDYLNGEIVALGRRYAVPTPINVHLQRLARQVAAGTAAPRAMTCRELLSHATD
jgi:2-dehydropantoate 2-reductase